MARSCAKGSARRNRAAAIGIVFALMGPVASAAGTDAATFQRSRDAARSEIANSRYQRQLPAAPKIGPTDRQRPKSRRGDMPRLSDAGFLESLGGAARILVWALVAVGLVLVVVYIANELPHLRRRRWKPDDGASDPAPGEVSGSGRRTAPGGLIDEADRLAGDGAFGLAIHVMLLALVDAPHGPIGRHLAQSLTGREIVGAARLAARPGAALSRIVAAAERSHFGGRGASRDDFEACRDDYAAVVAGLREPA